MFEPFWLIDRSSGFASTSTDLYNLCTRWVKCLFTIQSDHVSFTFCRVERLQVFLLFAISNRNPCNKCSSYSESKFFCIPS